MTTIGKSKKILITDMEPEEASEVTTLLAQAMSSNPVNQTVFQCNSVLFFFRQLKMFEYVTAFSHNTIRVAKLDGMIVGVMCYCYSNHCQLSKMQILFRLPSLIWNMGGDIMRLLTWRAIWSRHDHKEPHLHLGPIAVHPLYQGKGIGSKMLEEFCQELDATLINGYLETDKPENVVLYERFGFVVNKVSQVLGVTTWYMIRP